MAERRIRSVPFSVRTADFVASAVLRSGGWVAPLVLASSAAWLVAQALGNGKPGGWNRVLGWVAGSAALGTSGVLLAAGPAIAVALLSRHIRASSIIRSTAALPLVVPAFVLLHLAAPWIAQTTGLPVRNPAWAVLALAWGMGMPLWLSFSDALDRKTFQSWTEGALALGAHPAQILTNLSLPAARPGLLAALLRAVARASGETMAVLLVSGGFSPTGGSPTAGVALVRDLPEAIPHGDLWCDLMRGALLLSLWAMALHAIAQRLDPRWIDTEAE
ncbi:MAG TPA: ABC transporter permease subunit [Fibrobacteria bacterium]|nr:ABC transporter permease subunit [Fibrobacteria bacterium]